MRVVEYSYIILILILYFRTWKYYQLIDDFTPRGGYLLILGDKPSSPKFYDTKRPIMATITNIGVFLAACFAIHHLWGWKAALLYAVFPLNVSGVAWSTGNYYMTTVFLTLVSFFFSLKGSIGITIALPFYVAALGSTVSAIPFAFVCPLITKNYIHLIFFIPLLFFLFGHRFQTGLKLRKDKHEDIHIKAGVFRWKILFLVPKIIAYYAIISFIPSRLGMWHDFHRYEAKKGILGSFSRLFALSCLFLALFAIWGWQINPNMVIWWFLFIGVFSQFVTFGMMIAERYTYLANVAFCVLLSQYLPYELFLIVASLWFARSWIYIKAYRHNKSLFLTSSNAFPETPENYMNLASYYLEHGDPYKGIEPLLRANNICEEKNSGIHQNLASAYIGVKYYSKAKYHLEKALENCQQTNRTKLLDSLDMVNKRIEQLQSNKEKLKEVFK